MSKKQRDSLYAEVQKHQQSQDQPLGKEGANTLPWGYPTSVSSGLSDLEELSGLSDGLLFDFPLTPDGGSSYYSLELPSSTQPSPDPGEGHGATQDLLPGHCPRGEGQLGPDITPGEIDRVSQNIIRSHLDTCQFTSNELNRMTWSLHSQEDVRGLQSKPCEVMWHLCALQSPTPSRCLEILLIRMTRAFNPLTNTVLFEGKFGGVQMFRSLGCDDLLSAIFDLGRTLCRLDLSDEEIALFSAAVLMSPDRPWLTESNKVQKLQDRIFLALQRELQKKHSSDDLFSKVWFSLTQDSIPNQSYGPLKSGYTSKTCSVNLLLKDIQHCQKVEKEVAMFPF
ncbi:hypothetical protein FKM82_014879 [Ascaphus truei]